MDTKLVIDNGSGSIKIGSTYDKEPKIVHNCFARSKTNFLLPDQISTLTGSFEITKIYRSFNKGLLENNIIQKRLWHYAFKKYFPNMINSVTSVLLIENLHNVSYVRKKIYETIFEDFKFNSLYLTSGAKLVAKGFENSDINARCNLVVDSGFSGTFITPVIDGIPLNYAAKRMSVGAFVMNNHLRKVVSFREVDIRKDYFLAEKIRLKSCYVSLDFDKELHLMKKKRGKKCILPNGNDILEPIFVDSIDDLSDLIKFSEPQILTLNNEIICNPEALFHPSDIGINEAGLTESIVNSIDCTPIQLHSTLYSNIILTGGNCILPNFKKRLQKELIVLAPESVRVKIYISENPKISIWKGAANFTREADRGKYFITKKDYEEFGVNYCHRRFAYGN